MNILYDVSNGEIYTGVSHCRKADHPVCCRINQYFNGRCTDDEILFKADITRKQLREILHQYEEYVRIV